MELLERASFLQALGEYAGEAARGEGRLVLVSGESGMGKTALLEEFQHHTKGTRWLWGACDGLLTPRPLGPLFDMASQSGGELAALCRGDAARDRLFTAFLAEIGPPAPFTVAVIEDAHWADEATLDLLSFAGRRLGRTRALLLATYRDDELADDHPLREAAAQYERGLRFANRLDRPALAALHEGVAGEYALLDRWEDAESALRAALELRRQLGDDLSVGEDLRLLSRTLWRLCRGEEEVRAAEEAVRVLAALPPGRELAWAYAGLGAFCSAAGRTDEGLELLGKAGALGELLHEPALVSYALTQQGMTLIERGCDGTESVVRALGIALTADLQEAAGLAYVNLHEAVSRLNMFAEAERYYAEGMAYCEERELGVYSMCLLGWRAVTLGLLGLWDEAAEIGAALLGRHRISPVNRLNPLRVLGSIRGRRGEAGAWELLDEALELAEGVGEPPWIVTVRVARAELGWISGQPDLAIAEARSAYDRALGRTDPWLFGSVVSWLSRLGQPVGEASGVPEPFALEIAGDWREAAAAWERLSRPYDAALARLGSGDEAALRQALAVLDDLGAKATAGAARRRMKALGITSIPRGPRPATRAAPAGLTAREQQILALLAEGLPDREISRRLFISERTVHHHVSAVLAKIGVSSRAAAVREAARMGDPTPT